MGEEKCRAEGGMDGMNWESQPAKGDNSYWQHGCSWSQVFGSNSQETKREEGKKGINGETQLKQNKNESWPKQMVNWPAWGY